MVRDPLQAGHFASIVKKLYEKRFFKNMAGLTRFEKVITKQKLLRVVAVIFLLCSLFSCAALSTPALVSQIGGSALSSASGAPSSPFQVFQSEGWKIWENELLTYGETGDGLTLEELKALAEGALSGRGPIVSVKKVMPKNDQKKTLKILTEEEVKALSVKKGDRAWGEIIYFGPAFADDKAVMKAAYLAKKDFGINRCFAMVRQQRITRGRSFFLLPQTAKVDEIPIVRLIVLN